MAICDACGQEMTDRVGCTVTSITYDDGVYQRFRVRRKRQRAIPGTPTCGDCGAPNGRFHHPGCDLENCPRCRQQPISCGCGQRMWEDGVLSGA